jgi:hypothetical protein
MRVSLENPGIPVKKRLVRSLAYLEEIPYLGGPLGPLKVKEACQSPHLARIQGMKRISDPPLPIEV